jgi:predicted RNA-binding Zn ribbon-like protein
VKNNTTEGRFSMTKAALRIEPGAGHPFLCFMNTVADDGKSREQNSFADAAELQALMQAAGLSIQSGISDSQLQAMLRLREAAWPAFSALAAGHMPGREDALTLAAALKSVMAEADLQITPDGLRTLPGPLAQPHDLMVLSMEDLLRSDRFSRLRECRRCTHLFLDQGRGVGRRWCSMSRCGNRAKAEKFRARQRDAA